MENGSRKQRWFAWAGKKKKRVFVEEMLLKEANWRFLTVLWVHGNINNKKEKLITKGKCRLSISVPNKNSRNYSHRKWETLFIFGWKKSTQNLNALDQKKRENSRQKVWKSWAQRARVAVAVQSCRSTEFAKKLRNWTGISVFPWVKNHPGNYGVASWQQFLGKWCNSCEGVGLTLRITGGEYN